jgi:hypothetical protein
MDDGSLINGVSVKETSVLVAGWFSLFGVFEAEELLELRWALNMYSESQLILLLAISPKSR